MSTTFQSWGEALGGHQDVLDRITGICARQGVRVALVGGGVRDLLIGRGIRDLDLVIEGDAPEVARALEGAHGGRAQIHPSFGTATWSFEGRSVDLASARIETYGMPGALPEVRASSLEDDLARRDFSINAMALLIEPGSCTLLDPCGGREDIAARQLRVLHENSFRDDPTRIWRAARFASRMDLDLEPCTRVWMQRALDSDCLKTISLQRFGAELDRAFAEEGRMKLVRLARDWDLWTQISPSLAEAPFVELEEMHVDSGSAALSWLVLAAELPSAERERLALLTPGASEARRQWIRGDSLVEEGGRAAPLLDPKSTPSEVARTLEEMSPVELQLLDLRAGPVTRGWVQWWMEEGSRIVSVVDGHQLQALGFQPGPNIGRAKAAALDAARNGESEEEQLAAACRVSRD
jgi:tRNA nucleotidyltransferase/poly(A) polymerase